jgi:diguanylate cyclase (GGDEF)-like protein
MKIKDSIQRYLHGKIEFFRTFKARGDQVLFESSDINIQRFKILFLVAVPILAVILSTLFFTEVEPDSLRSTWKLFILIFDSAWVVAMMVFYFLLSHLHAKGKKKAFLRTEYLAVFFLVALNVAITVTGQLIHANLTVLIFGIVIVGTVVLLRPGVAAMLFFLDYLLFHFAVRITENDPILLLSLRLNGFVTITLGAFLSTIFWTNFLRHSEQIALIERQRTDLENKNAELYELATRDQLSGLINRRQTQNVLTIFKEHDLLHHAENGIAVLIADIDDFKSVNDRYGHPVGDLLIQEVSKMLVALTDRMDFVSRWGGDEFLITKLDSNLVDAIDTANTICQTFASTTFRLDGHEIKATLSIGVAMMKDQFEESYKNADAALYEAKKAGKNQIRVFETK